jgi:hypothetical protein
MCAAASRFLLTALGVLLCTGCAPHWRFVRAHQPPSEARVLVCRGSGAFVTCRKVDANEYRQAVRQVQGPLTGSRIAPR